MVVLGANRDRWLTEFGALGYPVMDATTGFAPDGQRAVFENGGVFSRGNFADRALVATVSPNQLACFLRGRIEQAFRNAQATITLGLLSADIDLGIEGAVNVLRVSDWSYGFWRSDPRRVTFEINGFNSAGLPGPDATFRIELTLGFALLPALAQEPTAKNVTVSLRGGQVHVDGPGHEFLAPALRDQIRGLFSAQPGGPLTPIVVQPTIPADLRVMSLITNTQGGLDFLLEPSIPNGIEGQFRRLALQNALTTAFPPC
jgi:hypothetical protein